MLYLTSTNKEGVAATAERLEAIQFKSYIDILTEISSILTVFIR